MRITLITLKALTILALTSAPPAWSEVHSWSHSYGSVDQDRGWSVAADPAGNIYVTGFFSNTVDFGGGPLTSAIGEDVFLVKYDRDGNHIWSSRFGGSSTNISESIALGSDGTIAITGYFGQSIDFGGGPIIGAGNFDIFVARFDADGNHLWSRGFGGTATDIGKSVSIDALGNVAVTGYFRLGVDFGGGTLTSVAGEDIFVARYDPDGNHIWSQRFGDINNDKGNEVRFDGQDNVVVAGRFAGTVAFGGAPIVGTGNRDTFLAKYDSSGAHIWSRGFGGDSSVEGLAMDVGVDDTVYMAGYFVSTVDLGGSLLTTAGDWDAFLAKYDADGNHLWSKQVGGSGRDMGLGIDVDPFNRVAVTGYFGGTADFGGGPLVSAGGNDIFIVKHDSHGNFLWNRTTGSAADDMGHGVATDGSGNLAATGGFSGTVDLGGGPLQSNGVFDIYLARYDDICSNPGAGCGLACPADSTARPGEHRRLTFTIQNNSETSEQFAYLINGDPGLTFSSESNPSFGPSVNGLLTLAPAEEVPLNVSSLATLVAYPGSTASGATLFR